MVKDPRREPLQRLGLSNVRYESNEKDNDVAEHVVDEVVVDDDDDADIVDDS